MQHAVCEMQAGYKLEVVTSLCQTQIVISRYSNRRVHHEFWVFEGFRGHSLKECGSSDRWQYISDGSMVLGQNTRLERLDI